jgi:hypothetical protein
MNATLSAERPVFGFITSGSYWCFLRLDDSMLGCDLRQYYYSELERIIGILMHIVGPPPAAPAAA